VDYHLTWLIFVGSELELDVLSTKATRLQLGNQAFVWLVQSLETVYHWTFVLHLRYQRFKTCSRHICSLVPTSLTNCFQSTSSEHCTALCYCTL